MLRPGPEYRREAFHSGLRAAGFTVSTDEPNRFAPADCLVIWNRYLAMDVLATRAEQAGVPVLVAENGYFQRPRYGGKHYAIALGGHNGQGSWPAGDGSRWAALGIELQSWRARGNHVLVCPNRPFGRPGFVMPSDWAKRTLWRLQALTKREVRLRLHPGNVEPAVPLQRDLQDAWAVVIWSSSAGVHALVAGIPVIAMCPAWICKPAAGDTLETIDSPAMPERLPVMQRLAWAMWSLDEISSGEPFVQLLQPCQTSPRSIRCAL